MSHSIAPARSSALLVASLISGCALHPPAMQRFGETPAQEEIREANLVGHIKCEIRETVWKALHEEAASPLPPGFDSAWLKGWGAKVNLKIVVDEKASLSPGLSFNDPLRNVVKTFPTGGNVTTSQNFSFGLGANVASDATRTETIGFFYDFRTLLGEASAGSGCAASDGLLIEGDLKIHQFLESKLFISRNPGLVPRKPDKSPFDVLTYQVTFVVTRGASATPSWKLVNISANAGGPLVSGSRTRTDDLLITMGPAVTNTDTREVEPSPAVRDAHLASLIGQAVANALQSQQP